VKARPDLRPGFCFALSSPFANGLASLALLGLLLAPFANGLASLALLGLLLAPFATASLRSPCSGATARR